MINSDKNGLGQIEWRRKWAARGERVQSIYVLERFDPGSTGKMSDYAADEGLRGTNTRPTGAGRLYDQLVKEG